MESDVPEARITVRAGGVVLLRALDCWVIRILPSDRKAGCASLVEVASRRLRQAALREVT